MEFLVNNAKVALNNGRNFGTEGDGFARINIGTNRAMLKEALENIAGALEARS
jgi:cysteine-S-conjugate beta-lyase